jgi:glycosyltransferase involved in cell wall biosynthesis
MIIASIGRYHFFEQARALAALGALDAVVADYPRGRLLAAGLPPDRLHAAPWLAATRLLTPSWRTYSLAGKLLAHALPATDGLVKINSAFAREAIARGRQVIVDHGSLHEGENAAYFAAQEGEFPGNHRHAWLIDREQEEFARAHRVLVLSELARRSLIAGGVAPEKIIVCAPGVDPARFHRSPDTGPRPYRVVLVSSLTRNKGLPGAELWLIGAGTCEPAPHVRVIGPVPQGNLPGLLSQCDLFVLPSLADGFGLVVLQAMACELPVIVSDRTGAAEAVAGEEFAGVTPAGDAEALADTIEYFYRLRADRAELGRLAREQVLARHTWPHHATRLSALIQKHAPPVLSVCPGDRRSVLAG